jgi:hypothetical protein
MWLTVWQPFVVRQSSRKDDVMAGFRDRISQRYATELDILACTVLESRPARIVDLSMHGAKVESDRPFAQGDSIALELNGERVFGTITWSEVDRMGVKFRGPLQDGLFRDALNTAIRRVTFQQAAPAFAAGGPRPSFGRRAPEIVVKA